MAWEKFNMIVPERLFEKNYPSKLALAKEAAGIFEYDFIKTPTSFMGYPIRLKNYPQNNSFGFNPTFWHIITNGEHQDSISNIDIERVTRIGWIQPIISNPDEDIWIYWEQRGNANRICLVYSEKRYVIILEPRYNGNKIKYILLWSAFFIIPESNLYKYKRNNRIFKSKYGFFDINHCPYKTEKPHG